MVLPNCELFDLGPSLARHARVIVRFEHSQNRQNAQSRFRVSRLRQVQILPQKGYLSRKGCRRFALRRNLADLRIERFGELMPLEIFEFGSVVERFRLNPAIEPRQVIGLLQQRVWSLRTSAPENLIPDNAQKASQKQTGSDANSRGGSNPHKPNLTSGQ